MYLYHNLPLIIIIAIITHKRKTIIEKNKVIVIYSFLNELSTMVNDFIIKLKRMEILFIMTILFFSMIAAVVSI